MINTSIIQSSPIQKALVSDPPRRRAVMPCRVETSRMAWFLALGIATSRREIRWVDLPSPIPFHIQNCVGTQDDRSLSR